MGRKRADGVAVFLVLVQRGGVFTDPALVGDIAAALRRKQRDIGISACVQGLSHHLGHADILIHLIAAGLVFLDNVRLVGKAERNRQRQVSFL